MTIIMRIKRKIKTLFLKRRSFLPPNTEENKNIDDLRVSIQRVELGDHSTSEWISNQKVLQKLILSQDPRDFLNWPIIRYTMFHDADRAEIEALKESPRWNSFYKNNIYEDAVGHPLRYLYNLKSSGNLIHHLYSLEQLCVHAPSFDLKNIKSIFEFGGGYGSFARITYRLGFQGMYTLYDFEIFNLLQKYFLQSSSVKNHINSISYVNNLNKIIGEFDLFVSLWALSESPISLRDQILERINGMKYVLIAYQNSFEGIDNQEYFKEIQARYDQFRWFEYDIPHLPDNRYLVGYKIPKE